MMIDSNEQYMKDEVESYPKYYLMKDSNDMQCKQFVTWT